METVVDVGSGRGSWGLGFGVWGLGFGVWGLGRGLFGHLFGSEGVDDGGLPHVRVAHKAHADGLLVALQTGQLAQEGQEGTLEGQRVGGGGGAERRERPETGAAQRKQKLTAGNDGWRGQGRRGEKRCGGGEGFGIRGFVGRGRVWRGRGAPFQRGL